MMRERCDEPPILQRLNERIDRINRYWLTEFGHYPKAEDSMVIIGVLAALEGWE